MGEAPRTLRGSLVGPGEAAAERPQDGLLPAGVDHGLMREDGESDRYLGRGNEKTRECEDGAERIRF